MFNIARGMVQGNAEPAKRAEVYRRAIAVTSTVITNLWRTSKPISTAKMFHARRAAGPEQQAG